MDFEWGADEDFDIIGDYDEDIPPEATTDTGLAEDDDPPADDYLDDPEQVTPCENTVYIMVVPPDERKCSNKLTKYEVAEIINIRATQIAKYANCLSDTEGLTDPTKQAWKELYDRRTPLIIRRYVGVRKDTDGKIKKYVELWRPCEMTIPLRT